jgi:hypothetical protein
MEQLKKAALTVNIFVAAYMFNFIRVNTNKKIFYVLLPYITYVMQSGRFLLYPAFRQKSGTKSTA